MREIRWNPLKSKRLKRTRGVSFEEIIRAKFIGIRKNPSRDNQRVLVYEYKGYIWAVPFVFEAEGVFLKTIYPTRKLKKIYEKGDTMRRMKLTRQERLIEDSIEKYVPVSKQEYDEIVEALERRKKDAVLNIRVNQYDLEHLKQKARKLGIKYQTFISEILHKVAQA